MNRWPFTFGQKALESGRIVLFSKSRASRGVEDWRPTKGMGAVMESLPDEKGRAGDDRPGSQKKSMTRKKAQGMRRGLFMGQTRK
jgi:hypothetical protein